MAKNPFRGRLTKDAAAKTINSLMDKKRMSAKMQRVMFARASASKHFILQVICPELLDVRARLSALEDAVAHLHGDEALRDQLRDDLKQNALKHLDELHEKDRLKHLSGENKKEVWAGVERAMVRDIYRKQRKPLLESAGIEEQPPVPEGQDPEEQP